MTFASLDPLLLLPTPPRCGILVGGADDLLAAAYGTFERTCELAPSGPLADAVVALEGQEPLARLAARARARLGAGGVLLARVRNRQLSSWLARSLYPGLRIGGPGATLAEIRRSLATEGFEAPELHAWLPTETFPYVSFPLHERRMQRFYMEQLMATWGVKGRIFSRLGPYLRPERLAPYFLVLARKGRCDG